MSSAADHGGRIGRYDLVGGPEECPLGETWIARSAVPGGSGADLVTLRRFGADCALSLQELKVLSEAAEWALSVKQEGVVPTTELVVAGQQLAWVRPWLLGEPLRQLLQDCASRGQAPSVEVGLRIVVDVLEAAASIAARPRRLASGALLNSCLLGPDVIWISGDGRSRITDMGVLAAAGSLDRFTKHPDLAAYRAPEQMGGFLADPRSDVFVAGILLWELISGGRRLFGGGELATVVGAVFASRVEQPGTPMSTNRQVDAGAVAVIMRALDRDPTRRFQGPQEMLQAIHDLGPEAVAKRSSVAEYLATVSNHSLSRERERVAQSTASARPPKPGAQEQPAAAADTRLFRMPLARGTDPAQVTGSQPARASSPPSARRPDGMAVERDGSSSRSSAADPRSIGSHPAAASQRPSTRPNAVYPRPSAEKALAGIKPVTVSPRPNTPKSLAQPPTSSAPPGLGQPARASKPAAEPSSSVAPKEPIGTSEPAPTASPSTSPEGAARTSTELSPAADSGTARKLVASAPLPGSEEPSGTGSKPVAMAAGAEQADDTKSDPKAAASPRSAEPFAAASGEAAPAACPPGSSDAGAAPDQDEMTPSSEPVPSMPILSISGSKQEDADERKADKEPVAAHRASTPPADEAPSNTGTADAPTAEVEKGSAAEAESTQARKSVPEPAASELDQGRATLPGFALETCAQSEAAARGENREATASGEKPPTPDPAAPAEGKKPDIAPDKGEAAVAAAPLLDEATTRALKPRFPLAVVLAAAALLAGGLYWLSGRGSAPQEQARPVEAVLEKRAPTVASAAAQTPTDQAPELSRAAAPAGAAPTTAKDEMPAKREPKAGPTMKKKRPISRHVAARAKPKPSTQPEASEPAEVTKSAEATQARRKPAAESVAPKKTSALDLLRRLEKERD